MAKLRFGPARVPARDSPKKAISLLQKRGFSACEIDFEGGFWMDYPWAERFGELAREAKIVLSVHAPIAGFMGHVERDKKQRMAVGMLDHSAGIAKTAGAELVVFHPGFLLGRERAAAIDSVCEQLAELRERLEGKDRAVPFGVEVMGRVRDLGSLDDVIEISRRLGWVRPVLDFAHMHATSDGGYTDVEPFAARARGRGRRARAEGAVPHPLQRHPVREQERDEAPPLRRGHAASRPAAQGAEALQASGHGDLGIARPQVGSGRARGALSRAADVASSRADLTA